MSYRIRVVDLRTNRIKWTPLKGGYLGVYEASHPQLALMIAEGVLQMAGEEIIDMSPVAFSLEDGGSLTGILVSGVKIGAVVEGAEIVSFSPG